MGEVSARARDDSPQSVGSATTYLRRYHLDSMVGVSSDEDDDGQAAQPEQPQPEQQPKGRKTQQSKDPADQAFGARAAAEAAAKAAGKTTSEKQPNDRIYDNNRLDRRKRLIATLSAMPYVPEGDRVAICQQLHGRHVEDLKTVIDEVRLQREARIAGEPTSQEVPV